MYPFEDDLFSLSAESGLGISDNNSELLEYNPPINNIIKSTSDSNYDISSMPSLSYGDAMYNNISTSQGLKRKRVIAVPAGNVDLKSASVQNLKRSKIRIVPTSSVNSSSTSNRNLNSNSGNPELKRKKIIAVIPAKSVDINSTVIGNINGNYFLLNSSKCPKLIPVSNNSCNTNDLIRTNLIPETVSSYNKSHNTDHNSFKKIHYDCSVNGIENAGSEKIYYNNVTSCVPLTVPVIPRKNINRRIILPGGKSVSKVIRKNSPNKNVKKLTANIKRIFRTPPEVTNASYTESSVAGMNVNIDSSNQATFTNILSNSGGNYRLEKEINILPADTDGMPIRITAKDNSNGQTLFVGTAVQNNNSPQSRKETKILPASTDESTIQIIANGNEYRSLQKLSPEQVDMVRGIIKNINAGGNIGEHRNVYFDTHTNTYVLYEVKNVDDDAKNDKRKKKKSSQAKKKKKKKLIGNNGNARTRYGRLSRPPKHIATDYKKVIPSEGEDGDSDSNNFCYTEPEQVSKESQIIDNDKVVDNIAISAEEKPVASDAHLFGLLKPKQRQFSSKSLCPTCGKVYLGYRRMWIHFEKNPDHRDDDLLNELKKAPKDGTEDVLSDNNNIVNDNKDVDSLPNAKDDSNKKCRNLKKQKLTRKNVEASFKRLLSACNPIDVVRYAGPAVTTAVNLYDLLLIRAKCFKTGVSTLSEILLNEVNSLISELRNHSKVFFTPVVDEDKENIPHKLEIHNDDPLQHILGLSPGVYMAREDNSWINTSALFKDAASSSTTNTTEVTGKNPPKDAEVTADDDISNRLESSECLNELSSLLENKMSSSGIAAPLLEGENHVKSDHQVCHKSVLLKEANKLTSKRWTLLKDGGKNDEINNIILKNFPATSDFERGSKIPTKMKRDSIGGCENFLNIKEEFFHATTTTTNNNGSSSGGNSNDGSNGDDPIGFDSGGGLMTFSTSTDVLHDHTADYITRFDDEGKHHHGRRSNEMSLSNFDAFSNNPMDMMGHFATIPMLSDSAGIFASGDGEEKPTSDSDSRDLLTDDFLNSLKELDSNEKSVIEQLSAAMSSTDRNNDQDHDHHRGAFPSTFAHDETSADVMLHFSLNSAFHNDDER